MYCRVTNNIFVTINASDYKINTSTCKFIIIVIVVIIVVIIIIIIVMFIIAITVKQNTIKL